MVLQDTEEQFKAYGLYTMSEKKTITKSITNFNYVNIHSQPSFRRF